MLKILQAFLMLFFKQIFKSSSDLKQMFKKM